MQKLIIFIFVATFSSLKVNANAEPKPPFYVNNQEGWRINQGMIERTQNAGKTWQLAHKDTSLTIRDLHFLNDKEGWAVGENGLVLRWDGEKWRDFFVFASANLNDVHLVSQQEGWIVGEMGTVLHWDGISWNYIPTPLEESLTKIETTAEGKLHILTQKGTILWREREQWQIIAPITGVATAQRLDE